MESASSFVPPSTPPKFFGIDIDGTFHANDPEVFAKNRQVFRKLVEAGYKPFICTGRPYFSALNVLHDLKADGVYTGLPGIYQNGALVYDESQNHIRLKKFGESFIREICDLTIKMGLQGSVVFLSEKSIFSLATKSQCCERLTRIWEWSANLEVATVEEIVSAGVLQIMLSNYHELFAHIKGREGVEYITKIGECGIGDLNPPDTTKAVGLKALLEHYGGSLDDCCYIGDGSNDMEALAAAKYSFAVGNAKDRVKACAKYALDETNEQGAFAKVAELVYGIKID
ncbi:haloacid dehalogenase-like hydrolase family member protein [Babesia ovis]|uniref:Haloacid dehalogenase-like hydrolase family member protein n=1 Tax=Babesia ovis TaxID=5869 RepID=A0A9W5TD58_BABOV|nr:haloacid dehalogenase-like hydrolase family member protein [Babesia ovis]